MNALQNLPGVGGGGPGVIGIGPRPPGAPMGGIGQIGQMQMGQHAMQGVAGGQQAGKFNSGIQLIRETVWLYNNHFNSHTFPHNDMMQYLPQQELQGRCR